jgi:NAD(P)-dependent dehydrogenase (short-subunit alcohol dehydrogenase family)
VLITGGSRGLGLALAERFARAGYRVALVARDEHELSHARELLLHRHAVSHPDHVLIITADLTDRAQAQSAVQKTIDTFGRLDVLINNAGVMEVAPMENQPLDAFERSMAIHFYAPLHTIQAALPHMLERHTNGERHAASIVNVGSIGGKVAMPHMLPYCAGKFALVGFSEGLHSELRHKGIRVTTVNPGFLRTGSHVQAHFAGQPEKEYRWFALGATAPLLTATAEDAANRIFRAVEAGRAEVTITPQAFVAARLHGLAPEATQFVASYVHRYVLPDASTNSQRTRGADLKANIERAAAEKAAARKQSGQQLQTV